jgi:hypothetical protein
LEGAAETAETASAEEPTLGALVDVDIVIETEPAAPQAPEPQVAEPEAERDAELEAETPDAETPLEAEAEPARDDEGAGEEEIAAAQDRKTQQDAAIQAVMSRMAGDVAASVVSAEAPEEDNDTTQDAVEADAEPAPEPTLELTDVRLGFSFLTPATVEASVEPDAPAEEDADIEPATEAEATPEPTPTPVYATVSVGPAPGDPAPPHPALAPASAPGLSGESEGPDHAEEEAEDSGVEEETLEPVIVAGPEAVTPEPEPVKKSDGGWVYPALLAIGMGLTGLGGWELASHWDAYSSLGLEFSPLGPVVFGAGVLLAVGAGWFTFRRR